MESDEDTQFVESSFTTTIIGSGGGGDLGKISAGAAPHTQPEHERQSLLTADTKDDEPAPAFYSVAYYRHLFNVTTKDVLMRTLAGMSPIPKQLSGLVSANPDLYGPFWVCTTLVFALAIAGNISKALGKDEHYDFGMLTAAAASIYGYSLLLPLCLYGVNNYYSGRLSFTVILSICGYAFFAYIPISGLCVMNGLWIFAGFVLSSVVMVVNLYPELSDAMPHPYKEVTMGALVASQFMLAFVLRASVFAG
eukprot:gnl/Hemi2/18965_TR6276_c0_g1_i1.p2 gnl/Hemi2/18965_TR6276_c0_g1~~gnl/Hemi2/18965_TR6276_c0_g1_i1.p2  ORF type:complete len:251 (-),score=59.84 gnl/Hemi2/18965_TR6276_c0_g1_i1:139-891(-)